MQQCLEQPAQLRDPLAPLTSLFDQHVEEPMTWYGDEMFRLDGNAGAGHEKNL